MKYKKIDLDNLTEDDIEEIVELNSKHKDSLFKQENIEDIIKEFEELKDEMKYGIERISLEIEKQKKSFRRGVIYYSIVFTAFYLCFLFALEIWGS